MIPKLPLIRRVLVASLVTVVALGALPMDASAASRSRGDSSAEEGGALEPLPAIEDTGIAAFDDVFGQVRDIHDILGRSVERLNSCNERLTRLGATARNPEEALNNLFAQAKGMIKVEMDGIKPKLSVSREAPAEVQSGITEVNGVVGDLGAIVVDMSKLPSKIKGLVDQTKSFPAKLNPAMLKEAGLKATDMPKVAKTLGRNVKATAQTPGRIDEVVSSVSATFTVIKNAATNPQPGAGASGGAAVADAGSGSSSSSDSSSSSSRSSSSGASRSRSRTSAADTLDGEDSSDNAGRASTTTRSRSSNSRSSTGSSRSRGSSRGGDSDSRGDSGGSTAVELPPIEETGISEFDSLFRNVADIHASLADAREKVERANRLIAGVGGDAAGMTPEQALQDLMSQARDSVKVSMDGIKPKLSVSPSAPADVRDGIADVNSAVGDLSGALADLGSLAPKVKALIDESKALPGKLSPAMISSNGLRPTDMPKVAKRTASNVKATAKTPEAITALTEEIKASFAMIQNAANGGGGGAVAGSSGSSGGSSGGAGSGFTGISVFARAVADSRYAFDDAEVEQAAAILRNAEGAIADERYVVSPGDILEFHHFTAVVAIAEGNVATSETAMRRAVAVDPDRTPSEALGPKVGELHSQFADEMALRTVTLKASGSGGAWVDGKPVESSGTEIVAGEHIVQVERSDGLSTELKDIRKSTTLTTSDSGKDLGPNAVAGAGAAMADLDDGGSSRSSNSRSSNSRSSNSRSSNSRSSTSKDEPVDDYYDLDEPASRRSSTRSEGRDTSSKSGGGKSGAKIGLMVVGGGFMAAGGVTLGLGYMGEGAFHQAAYNADEYDDCTVNEECYEDARIDAIVQDATMIRRLYTAGYALLGGGVVLTSAGLLASPTLMPGGGAGIQLSGNW